MTPTGLELDQRTVDRIREGGSDRGWREVHVGTFAGATVTVLDEKEMTDDGSET